MKWALSLLLAILPLISHAEITDAELRKLFIVTEEEIGEFQYGGIVFFKGYFQRNKTACAFKRLHPEATVFVDQEGGEVVRIAGAAPPSPSQAKQMKDADFYIAVKESARKLKSACIDVNLAPVVQTSNDSVRSYGAIPEAVVPKAKVFSQAMQSEGVRTVLKHFPGWTEGCKSVTSLDSIKLKVRANSEALKCSVPEGERYRFMEGIRIFNQVPADAWMVANNVIPELGPYPSNMNPLVHDLIRNELAYKGLLISDALWEIEASPKAILMALKVVDWVMIGYSNQAELALPVIKAGINAGLFSEEELRGKISRINAFKKLNS
jgi:beta-N-acetylhexosaminidase